MAKAQVERKLKVLLEIDDAEAHYLLDLLQNYLGSDEEPPEQREIRQDLFHVISDVI